ncbi:reverse transcriptase domain-containing protein, partial [Tanacetum coccineum]
MSDYIPFEMQIEIMYRLPVKSLLHFRTVSKSWKSYIDSTALFFNYGVRKPVNDVFYEELQYGVLLPNDVNYSNLVRYVKKKFKLAHVFRDSFNSCLSNLEKMLKRCEDTNLVLNWEKCHFMCKEGIVLGHKISKARIEVDRAKIDVIAKLPHPTTVKGTLKKKLTQAPILVVTDWNLPFELMCDASDFTI